MQKCWRVLSGRLAWHACGIIIGKDSLGRIYTHSAAIRIAEIESVTQFGGFAH
ncbi:MAG: hypothetical protein MZV63_03440 [Marinilabiliales bacterium]|nr:hypothetical protein [Marinilabiliales bacterium]